MLTTPSNEQVKNAAHTVLKACEEMNSMARDHIDATMKSASAMTKGWDEIARNAQTLLQDNFTRSVNAGKTMMNARTLPEITDMHQELVKDIFDSWVAITGKISQISARLTQDVMSPITENATNTMGKLTQKLRAAA